jgi:hypothetical protein
MVQQRSVQEALFNRLSVTPVILHVVNVLDLLQANVLHAELVHILRDGREQRLLAQVTWSDTVLVSQRQCLGLTVESIQETSGSSMMHKPRIVMCRLLLDSVVPKDLPIL